MKASRRSCRSDDRGISSIIGGIIIVALVFAFLVTIRVSFVPVWEKDAESSHLITVEKQMTLIQAEMAHQVDNRTASAITNGLTLSEPRASIFQTGHTTHSVTFSTSAGRVSLASNKFLILNNNGTSITGLNPTWINVPSSGTVTDIARMDSLRIRLINVDNQAHRLEGHWINLTARDASSTYVGSFNVTIKDAGNDYVISAIVRDSNNNKISEDANSQDDNTVYSNYFIDALDPSLLFNQILGAATKPLTLQLTKDGPLNGDYTISYGQAVAGGGEILLGGTGVLKQPYAVTYNGGSLIYQAVGQYYVSQNYILENGALILSQPDGAVFKIPPAFTAGRAGNLVAITWNLPSLGGAPASISGAENIKVTTQATQNTNIQAQAPRYQVTINTAFPALWAAYWNNVFGTGGLGLTNSGAQPQYTVTTATNQASLAVYGITADPASTAYDLAISFKQAPILVTLGG